MKQTNIEENARSLSQGMQVVPEDGLKRKLAIAHDQKKPLCIKLGFDPTAPDLHLGHAVVLRKLKEFQDMGHDVCVIIGDFTARIGDPSGKNKTRPPLSEEEVEENAQTYLAQLGKILDLTKITIRKNSEWLTPMNLMDVISLLSKVTLAQVMQRHDFGDRYKNHQPIALHEILYPLLQGQDSVAIKADVELGGTDQLFNCMMGKTLQEIHELPSQIVMCVPLLRGTDGVHKMGKSLNNYIGLTEDPNTMYAKVMSIPDLLIEEYLTLTTRFHEENKLKLSKDIALDPMGVKKKIAFDIVGQYHSDAEAIGAEQAFYKNVQSKNWYDREFIETNLSALERKEGEVLSLLDVSERLLGDKSRGFTRKLILAGSVSIGGNKIMDPELKIHELSGPIELKIGKRHFYKLIF